MNKVNWFTISFISLLVGCATTGTDGIVEISPNLYMHGSTK